MPGNGPAIFREKELHVNGFKTISGAVVALVATLTGMELEGAEQVVADVVTVVGILFSIYGRVVAQKDLRSGGKLEE